MNRWTLNLIFASLACSVITGMTPEKKKKLMKIVLGIYLLTVIISPIRDLIKAIQEIKIPDIISIDSETYENTLLSNVVEESGKAAIKSLIDKKAQENGWELQRIAINTQTDEKNVINITGIDIELSNKYRLVAGRIKTVLEDELGIPVDVICVES